MKKLLFFLLAFLYINIISAQPLFRGLVYDMPRKKAYKEYKRHRSDYINIRMDQGIVWSVYKHNMSICHGKLKGLMLVPRSTSIGMSHVMGKEYLDKSFQFLINRGYTIWREPKDWNDPLYFNRNNASGIVLVSPSKHTTVELRPTYIASTNNFTITLMINTFRNYIDEGKNRYSYKRKKDDTGF